VLFERIYEDSVAGKISEERFAKMSRRYEDEQTEIHAKIEPLEKEIHTMAKKSGTAQDFLATGQGPAQMSCLYFEAIVIFFKFLSH
jgi:hypothetical protein